MRVLVTGATGFIGRTLVKRLLGHGHDPILLVEDSGAAEGHLETGVNNHQGVDFTFSGDLRNRNQIIEIVRASKPDKVIHLAAVGVTDPFLDYQSALEHNLLGTLNLLHALFESGKESSSAKQIIVARTPGEAENMNVYAASKAAVWAFCSMYARTRYWPISGAVIFQAYGPGQPSHTLVPAALKAALVGEDFRMTYGDQQRDWIFIEDVADGLIAALDTYLAPGESFDLGTGITTSLLEVVRRVYRIVDRGGAPNPGAMPDRPGEAKTQIADANRTEQLTGWRSSISLDEGLHRVLASTTLLK
jgi:nucleoside-diphosphate-sugar epimerase